MKPRIIGLSGNKGVGKSTVAGILRKHGYSEISFAEPLKLALVRAIGCDYNDLDDPKIKDEPLILPLTLTKSHLIEALLYLDNTFKKIEDEAIRKAVNETSGKTFYTYREIMQFFGTEVIRDHVGADYWVEVMRRRVNQDNTKQYVITDARFPNERSLVKELNGLTALVTRPQTSSTHHRSENQLGKVEEYDLVLENTGTVAQLAYELDLWFALKGVK